ncbi:MAG: ferredoxin:thioredoxin reductase [Methanomicrobiales archaeon]|jgi:ferredoxin-thioredoxin reductase catalytic subunit|nr:ferredoxin:thioredoxin reductase [Methanomicrobiales archaeon]
MVKDSAKTSSVEEDGIFDEILTWAEAYARENGWRLNPELKKLEVVIRGLARNQRRYGLRYCPCRLRSGDAVADREIVCPCIFHEGEIARDGSCHCNLFFSLKTPESV